MLNTCIYIYIHYRRLFCLHLKPRGRTTFNPYKLKAEYIPIEIYLSIITSVCLYMYADDIVLGADTEEKL
jgi:hypothetical protein